MVDLNVVANIGGLFVLFAFVHLVLDYFLRTENEALYKCNNDLACLWHCAIYVWVFMVMFLILGVNPLMNACLTTIIFISHLFSDTSVLLYLWAKYIRKPVQNMTDQDYVHYANSQHGQITLAVVDQIIRLFFVLIAAIVIIISTNNNK